jgi:hypothetical protein
VVRESCAMEMKGRRGDIVWRLMVMSGVYQLFVCELSPR